MSVQDVRLGETVRYLEAEALDGLVAVNYGHNSFLESHAVFVLSGVRPIGESAVVVSRSGASTLIVTPAWDAERKLFVEPAMPYEPLGMEHAVDFL